MCHIVKQRQNKIFWKEKWHVFPLNEVLFSGSPLNNEIIKQRGNDWDPGYT